MGKQIQKLLRYKLILQDLKTSLRRSDTTRRKTYLDINPDLDPSPVYSMNNIPERDRIALSRIRLSSHRLKIETGRWSRIPTQDRLCQCGQAVQTESHVLLRCILTEHLQNEYNIGIYTCLSDMFKIMDPHIQSEYCRKVLNIYGL